MRSQVESIQQARLSPAVEAPHAGDRPVAPTPVASALPQPNPIQPATASTFPPPTASAVPQPSTTLSPEAFKDLQQRVAELRLQVEGQIKSNETPLRQAPISRSTTVDTLPAASAVVILVIRPSGMAWKPRTDIADGYDAPNWSPDNDPHSLRIENASIVAKKPSLPIDLCWRTWAQSAKPTQRTFSAPKPQVERALRQLAGSSGGKLPILVGFAVPGDHSLERFRQGYYEYEIAVTAINARETAVQVTAKITAWYAGEKPEESNYELLGSNGRLESDLLDRLADALKSGQAPVQPPLTPVGTDAHRAPDPRPDAPSTAKVNYLSQYLRQAAPKTEATGGQPAPAPAEAVTDQQISKLTREEAALAQIKISQARPADLAVVKAPKTPVLSRPSKDAQVVLVAEADDELQVLDVNNDWVHVHLMGLSRGWVRRSQLDLSNVSLPATAIKQAGTTSQDQRFQKTREETGTFPGQWKPLEGKK